MGNKMDKVIFPTSDYIEINPPTKSICGSIASFSDGGNAPIPSLTVSIEPQQDLHGYDSPWAGGAGKNKFNANNVTAFTNMELVNGIFRNTATDTKTMFSMAVQLWNGSTYITEFTKNITSTGRASITFSISSTVTRIRLKHNGSSNDIGFWFNWDRQGTYTLSLNVTGVNPTTIGGLSFTDVQIEEGSTETSYAPYENICPISGWTEEVITRCGKNLYDLRTNRYMQGVEKLKVGDTLYIRTDYKIRYNLYIRYSGDTIATEYAIPANETVTIPLNKTVVAIALSQPDAKAIISNNKEFTISLAPIDEVIPYAGTTTTIPFVDGQGQSVEVFGGSVDVINGGEQQRTLGSVDLGTLNWFKGNINTAGTGRIFYVPLTASSPMKQPSDNGFCEALTYNPFSNWTAGQWERQRLNGITVTNSSALVACVPDIYATASDFKTVMNGVKLVYELATPTTFYIHPTSIKSLDGENNVWASTGDVCVTYVTQEYQDLAVNYAATASKLGSSNVGSATNPIYLSGGTATACTYTLGKSVPSDAVFTDTDTKVTQTATSTNADYEVLFSGTADNTTRTEGARKDSNLLYNPSSNTLKLKNTSFSNSITPSSISLSNSSGGGISIDNTNNQIEVGKSGTSITYSNTDVVTSNGNTWDGTNTSLKDAIANIIDLLHPVGSIYMSLTDSTVAEVEAKFGGTWEKIEDRFLLAASSSYAVDSTGGSADAVVVSHTHELAGTNAKAVDVAAHTHPLAGTNAKAKAVDGHTHTEYAGINEATSGLFTSITGTRSYPNTHIIGGPGTTSKAGGHSHTLEGNTSTGGAHGHSLQGNTKSSGESGTGKNMPPYLAVYMYKRTA